MPIPMDNCKKHGVVRFDHYSVCHLCASEAKDLAATDNQQLKPKMPLLEEIKSELREHSSSVDQYALYSAGIDDCYNIISRHFGH